MRWYDRRRSGLLFFCLPRTHPLGVRSGNLQSGRRTKGKFCSELQIPNKSRSPVPARRLSAIRHGHVLEEYVSYVEMLKGMKDNCQDTYTLLARVRSVRFQMILLLARVVRVCIIIAS